MFVISHHTRVKDRWSLRPARQRSSVRTQRPSSPSTSACGLLSLVFVLLLGCTPKRVPPTEPWEFEPLADWIRAEKLPPPAPPPAGYADYGEHLRASMRSQARGLQRCYRQVLKHDRRLYGELVLHLTIQADGRLSAVEVDYGTLQGPELEQCVTTLVRPLTVAKPPRDGFVVRYPLVFTSSRTPPEVVDALRRRYQLAAPEAAQDEKRSRPPADPIPW